MSNNDIAGELELTAEDLEWIAKYGNDAEFQDNDTVDMGDEAHPEDDLVDKANDLAIKAADTPADLVDKPKEADIPPVAVDEAAEQQLYADLLSINEKQEELTEALKANIDSLSAKETELAELAKQLDDGDLGQGEYDLAKTKLVEGINELKSQVKALQTEESSNKKLLEDTAVKVDELAKVTQQREVTAKAAAEQSQVQWDNDCNAFLAKPENKIFADDKDKLDELAGFVTVINQRNANKGVQLTNDELLNQARRAVAALHDDVHIPTKAKPAPQLPRTLGAISAAANPTVSAADDFPDLESMSPQERDQAMMSMSREQMKKWAKGQ